LLEIQLLHINYIIIICINNNNSAVIANDLYKTARPYIALQNFDGYGKDYFGIYVDDSGKRPQKQFVSPGIVRLKDLGVFIKCIHIVFKQKMNVTRSLLENIKTKQLQWYGHVRRLRWSSG
jgi:hypothetical protein